MAQLVREQKILGLKSAQSQNIMLRLTGYACCALG